MIGPTVIREMVKGGQGFRGSSRGSGQRGRKADEELVGPSPPCHLNARRLKHADSMNEAAVSQAVGPLRCKQIEGGSPSEVCYTVMVFLAKMCASI